MSTPSLVLMVASLQSTHHVSHRLICAAGDGNRIVDGRRVIRLQVQLLDVELQTPMRGRACSRSRPARPRRSCLVMFNCVTVRPAVPFAAVIAAVRTAHRPTLSGRRVCRTCFRLNQRHRLCSSLCRRPVALCRNLVSRHDCALHPEQARSWGPKLLRS